MKEKLKRIEGEKMELELHVADVVDDHKIKMEKMRLKITKIRKYAIDSVAWYHYDVGSIVVGFRSNFKKFPTRTQDHVMHSNERRVLSTYPTQTDCGSNDTT